MLKNLLIYRIALFNIAMVALMGLFATKGWIQYVFANDHSRISFGIAALLVVGLVGCFHRATKVSKALNTLKSGEVSLGRGAYTTDFQKDIAKMPIKNRYLHILLDTFTGLAIIGTLIGLVLMASSINTSDLQGSLPAVLKNVSVAFMATLTGITAAMWLAVPVCMLDTATALLVKDSE